MLYNAVLKYFVIEVSSLCFLRSKRSQEVEARCEACAETQT